MDSPFVQALAASALGSVDVIRGVTTRAVDMLEQSNAVCRAGDLRAIRPWINAEIGRAYLLSSRVDEALDVLAQALREAAALGLMAQQSMRLALFAEACLRAGRRREASDSAAQAVAMASERGERGFKAWALRTMGEVAAAGDPTGHASARAHFEAARALADELGMRPLVAHCHAGLARLDQQAANRPAASEHAAQARALYRDMGMDRWLAALDADIHP
jgi:tetratricopeptide (TPR) repeat protein